MLCVHVRARVSGDSKSAPFPFDPLTKKNRLGGIIMSTDEFVKYTVLLYSLFADTLV
jgi:hypothetical protein